MIEVASTIDAADKAFMAILSRIQRPWLVRFMGYLTRLASAFVFLPACIFFLVFGQGQFPTVAFTTLIGECILLPIIVLLRYRTRRERPSNVIARQWTPWNRFSFPSHHSARAWMVVPLVLVHYPDALPSIVMMAIFISFSRLYLQKHYPSDVLTGAVLGLCVGLAVRAVYSPSSIEDYIWT